MDFLSWLSITGLSAKDIIEFVFGKLKKDNNEYDIFTKGIKETIKATCNKYREFIKVCTDCKDINLPLECDEEIYNCIISALEKKEMFTIDMLLPKEDIPIGERRRLYKLLQMSLSQTLEYSVRDYINWSKKSIEYIQSSLDKIISSVNKIIEQEKLIENVSMNLRHIWNIEPINIEFINRNKNEAIQNNKYAQAYFDISDREDILYHAICGNFDIKDDKLIELLYSELADTLDHLFIMGRGGEGKTSLLFRMAVEYAKCGYSSYWLRLSNVTINSGDKFALSDFLDAVNKCAILNNTKAILFVDNLCNGYNLLDLLQSSWKEEYNIRLVCAERIEYINKLCSPTKNLLAPWISHSKFICLRPENEVNKTILKYYDKIFYTFSYQYKMKVLKNLSQIWDRVDKKNFQSALYQVGEKMKNKDIPIAELILNLKMQYNLLITSDDNVNINFSLPWDMWDTIIDQRFNLTNSFRWVATFSRIGKELSVKSLANYYGINFNIFSDLLRYNYESQIYTPYQIVNKNNDIYIKTPHDIIPDLYFGFTKHITFGSFDENINNLDAFIVDDKKNEVILAAADYYFDCNQYSEAINLYNKLLEDDISLLTKALINKRLCDVYRDEGSYDKAVLYGKESTCLYTELKGEADRLSCGAFSALGLAYQYKNDFNKALDNFKKSMNYFEITGTRDIQWGYINNSIGLTYRSLEKYSDSLRYFKEAEMVLKKELSSNDPDIAMVYNNMAGSYLMLGNFEYAKKYYAKALKIRRLSLGENHPYTATTYQDYGQYFYEVGKYRQAIIYYNKALDIYNRFFSSNHYDIGEIYYQKGKIYEAQGKIDKAFKFFHDSELILKNQIALDSEFYIEIKNKLEEVEKQCKTQKR